MRRVPFCGVVAPPDKQTDDVLPGCGLTGKPNYAPYEWGATDMCVTNTIIWPGRPGYGVFGNYAMGLSESVPEVFVFSNRYLSNCPALIMLVLTQSCGVWKKRCSIPLRHVFYWLVRSSTHK